MHSFLGHPLNGQWLGLARNAGKESKQLDGSSIDSGEDGRRVRGWC
jgi:hypothetical protein